MLHVQAFLCASSLCTGLLLNAALYAQPPGRTVTLPEDSGKDLVESACSGCHGLYVITRSAGFSSKAKWQHLFSTMIDLPTPQAETIATYLAKHFPENENRRPKLVPGDATMLTADPKSLSKILPD